MPVRTGLFKDEQPDRYREVAVNRSHRRGRATALARTLLITGILGSLLPSAVGCGGDAITFASESRRQGLALYREGKYADAAGTFKNATRKDPRDYLSYYYLGMSYDALKRYQEAIGAYRSSLDTMDLIGESRRDVAFRRKVIDALAIAVAKSPDRDNQIAKIKVQAPGKETSDQFLLLAKIDRYCNDPDGAIDAYNRAALLDPKDFGIAKEYGLYLAQLGQDQRAEPLLRRAYQINSKDVEVVEALRKLGVVPGPSLKDEKDLAHPIVTPNVGNTSARTPQD
jgi:tetratricopeptide (TPR) repeat protein